MWYDKIAFCIILLEVLIISSKDLQINEEIKDKQVRLIDVDGNQLGVVDIDKALELANEQVLDLVKIAPQAVPPVCRIMDYGKYRFELAKKEKENRKNQKVVEVKEVRLTPVIDTHDFDTKVNHATKFLKHGDKVKVSVRFRGREMNNTKAGEVLLNKFAETVEAVGVVEKPPKMEGKSMVMFLNAK